MNQHPLSAAFPSMTDEDFQTLKDSIDAIGVQNPVTIYEGQIIDGWHRYRAAQELCINESLRPDVDWAAVRMKRTPRKDAVVAVP